MILILSDYSSKCNNWHNGQNHNHGFPKQQLNYIIQHSVHHIKQSTIPHWKSKAELMYFAFPKLTQMCGFWGVKHLCLLLWVYRQSPLKDYNIIWKPIFFWVTLPVSFCMTIGDGLLMIWRHYEGSFYPQLLS